MATYKRLTLAQRYLIQSLHQQHKTQQFMAQQLGVSQATISRELAKHSDQCTNQTYHAQQAQQRAGTANKRTSYKLKPGRRSGATPDDHHCPATRPSIAGTNLW